MGFSIEVTYLPVFFVPSMKISWHFILHSMNEQVLEGVLFNDIADSKPPSSPLVFPK